MFYKKRMEDSSSKWAVVILDANLLKSRDARFYRSNAGRYKRENSGAGDFTSLSAFNSLFEEPRYPSLPINYPSDPQAEVMVHDGVSPKYIREIHFLFSPQTEVIKDIRERMQDIAISKSERYFDYRLDWAMWQKKSLSEILMG